MRRSGEGGRGSWGTFFSGVMTFPQASWPRERDRFFRNVGHAWEKKVVLLGNKGKGSGQRGAPSALHLPSWVSLDRAWFLSPLAMMDVQEFSYWQDSGSCSHSHEMVV